MSGLKTGGSYSTLPHQDLHLLTPNLDNHNQEKKDLKLDMITQLARDSYGMGNVPISPEVLDLISA